MEHDEADERHRRWPQHFDARGRIIVREPIWMPSVEFLAQSCHVGWGAFITLAFGLKTQWWVGLAILAVVIPPKELLIDPWIEGVTWQSELPCIAYYSIGAAVGVATLLW